MSDEVLVKRADLQAIVETAEVARSLITAVANVTARETSPFTRPGEVPIELQFMILTRWGDVAGIESGIPADTRGADAMKMLCPGDLVREAAAVTLAWIESSAIPVLELELSSPGG